MAVKPFTNTAKHVVFIGTTLVPPGETRFVDERLLASERSQSSGAAQPPDPLTELLKKNVSGVIAGIEDLTIDDLEKLGDLEQLGQHRKGVLSAISERILSLSSNMQGDGMDSFFGGNEQGTDDNSGGQDSHAQ